MPLVESWGGSECAESDTRTQMAWEQRHSTKHGSTDAPVDRIADSRARDLHISTTAAASAAGAQNGRSRTDLVWRPWTDSGTPFG